jgi:class 3 adenylate cyclase
MQDDARWYAALAAANVNQMQAVGLFSNLSKDAGSKYQQAAQAVLSSILKSPDNFSFQVDTVGTMLQFSLVVAAEAAWWQAGWVRALIGVLFPVGGLGLVFWRNKYKKLEIEKNSLTQEKKLSDELLHNVLPAETAEELKKYGTSGTRRFEQVTVLFCDFMGFTKISEILPAEELVAKLGECFEAYDRIVEKFDLEKIKTVGDCYICAGGLRVETDRWTDTLLLAPDEKSTSHNGWETTKEAIRAVKAAQQILVFLEDFNARQAESGKPLFQARIGIHTGPVVAGIVGIKKFAYDIWGDTVNIAARMEQSSEGGRINISGATYELVKSRFPCRYRGKVDAKGKGAVDMYFVE